MLRLEIAFRNRLCGADRGSYKRQFFNIMVVERAYLFRLPLFGRRCASAERAYAGPGGKNFGKTSMWRVRPGDGHPMPPYRPRFSSTSLILSWHSASDRGTTLCSIPCEYLLKVCDLLLMSAIASEVDQWGCKGWVLLLAHVSV